MFLINRKRLKYASCMVLCQPEIIERPLVGHGLILVPIFVLFLTESIITSVFSALVFSSKMS